MSFAEQERALFDLLFDSGLRSRFEKSAMAALADYELDDSERADFSTIRADGLALDAYLRADFILSHLCRTFPLSFSIASSLTGGLDLLRELIDTHTMRTAPDERPAAFGARLRNVLASKSFDSPQEQAKVIAIAEAELGMAMTAGTLRQTLASGGSTPSTPATLSSDWRNQPIKLAAYVSATVIPRSYPQLKSALCPTPDTELWAHLSGKPLAATRRSKALSQDDPRLLLAQARALNVSTCDIITDHVTMELSDGFAPLLAHVDGKTSVAELLAQMEKIGAPFGVLRGIEDGFRNVLEMGFLELKLKVESEK